MKTLFLLTLLAGGSTAILYNVAPYYEQTYPRHEYSEQSYENARQPQIFGQLDEEYGWKTTIIYGDPIFDHDCEQRTYAEDENNSLYSSYYSNYNDIEESYWPVPRYECDSIYDDLYLQHYRDLEFYPVDLYSDFGYNEDFVIPNGSFNDYSEWPEY